MRCRTHYIGRGYFKGTESAFGCNLTVDFHLILTKFRLQVFIFFLVTKAEYQMDPVLRSSHAGCSNPG